MPRFGFRLGRLSSPTAAAGDQERLLAGEVPRGIGQEQAGRLHVFPRLDEERNPAPVRAEPRGADRLPLPFRGGVRGARAVHAPPRPNMRATLPPMTRARSSAGSRSSSKSFVYSPMHEPISPMGTSVPKQMRSKGWLCA